MKIFFNVCAIIVLILFCAFVVGAAFSLFSDRNKNQHNVYEPTEEFNKILIDTDIADVIVLPSSDGKVKVSLYERVTMKHSVAVSDGVLTIQSVDTRKWYDHIALFLKPQSIKLYLPEGEYESLKVSSFTSDLTVSKGFSFASLEVCGNTGDVSVFSSAKSISIEQSTGDVSINGATTDLISISLSTGDVEIDGVDCSGVISVKGSTGDVELENATAGEVTISLSTGDVDATNLTCKNLIIQVSTGDVTLNNTVADEKFNINTSTGEVNFMHCDAAEIFVKTDTGDVRGSLNSGKSFFTRTDTGSVRVPETTGGRCEIITDTGDIKITID